MSPKSLITKETSIAEAINICPKAADVFTKYKMGCFACLAASAETIEEGALMHDIDVQAIVNDLNAACETE